MLFVMLTVGGVVLVRAHRLDEAQGEEPGDEPLVWADVERQFERVDRRGGQVAAPGDPPPEAPGPAGDPAPADR
jgi:hypothetical protein